VYNSPPVGLLWVRWAKFLYSHPVYQSSVTLKSSRLRLILRIASFSWCFQTIIASVFLGFRTLKFQYVSWTFHTLGYYHHNNIISRAQIMMFLTCSYLHPTASTSRYFPQHFIIKLASSKCFPESNNKHNKRASGTAVTSLNNEAATRSGVFLAVRCQAESDVTMAHVTLLRIYQQSNCKRCFLWGPPRGYIRIADESFQLVRRFWVGLQAGDPGPWEGGHGQSRTVLSRRLVSAVPKLQVRQE
jgi:hypothetical protein